MRLLFVILCLTALGANAQPVNAAPLLDLSSRIRKAIEADDWKSALDLSQQLKGMTIEVRDRESAAASDREILQIIESLPQSVETVIVTPTPFRLPEADPQLTMTSSLDQARRYVTGLFGAVVDGKLWKAQAGKTLRFAVLVGGAFSKHPPDGSNIGRLGLTQYQGCGFYATSDPVTEQQFGALPDSVIQGRPVWTSRGKQSEQGRDAVEMKDTFVATLLRPNLVAVCNNTELFSSLLAKWATPTGTSSWAPILVRLPEVQHVDRSAAIWGVRHFSGPRSPMNALDPRNGGFGGQPPDDHATGVAFQISARDQQVKSIWVTTGTAHPFEPMAQVHGAAAVKATKLQGVGWQLVLDAELSNRSYIVFGTMALLGFIVYV